MIGEQRVCTKCGVEKELVEFFLDRGRPASRCKTCVSAAVGEYQRVNAAFVRQRQRDWKYGLEPGEYDRRLEGQGGVCVICGGDNGGRSLHVDHDHTTEKVRGLACFHCNAGMGHFKDDPALLRAAARYLEDSAAV